MPAKDEKSTTAQKVEKNDSLEKKSNDVEDKEKDKKQSEDNQFEDDDDFEEFPVNTPGDVQLPPEFVTEDVVSEQCLPVTRVLIFRVQENVWEENWEDEGDNEDFAADLRRELEAKNTARNRIEPMQH